MIELTDVAAEKLRAMRDADPAKAYLRVYVAGKSCCGVQYALAFDEETAPTDTVVKSGGIPVTIDAQSRPHVEGATIDFVDALMGGGFVVRKEQAGGGCACGRR